MEKKRFVGIDLGGTTIHVGVLDEDGKILFQEKYATAPEKAAVIDTMGKSIEMLKEKFEPIAAIGIGTPGTVDVVNKRIMDIGGNVTEWAHTPLGDVLKPWIGDTPLYVDNDANCVALAESAYGKDYEVEVVITLGTGLGGAVLHRGELLRGEHFQGGELGHVLLYPGGRLCGCGQKGCVEQYASGTGIQRNYEALTKIELSGVEISERMSYDRHAKEALVQFARDLGYFLVTIKNLLDPGRVIIGGGVSESKDSWWDDMMTAYENAVNHTTNMEIILSHYGSDAGLIGAAKLAEMSLCKTGEK